MAFSYGQTERALGRLHAVDVRSWGSFKARIRKLQQQAIVPATPGKGQRISYRPADIYCWAFCLQLAEFGIDAKIARRFVEEVWGSDTLHKVSEKIVIDAGEDQFFLFDPNMLSGWYVSDGQQHGFLRCKVVSEHGFTVGQLKQYEYGSGSFINLTDLRRRVDRELAKAALEKPGKPGRKPKSAAA